MKFNIALQNNKSMILAYKQNEEQKRSNDYAKFQFIMAMMNLDHMLVRSLLKKDSRFLGWMNVWQFTAWLRKEFKKINPNGFHSRVKEMICLDICPGAEMLTFEYAKMGIGDFIEGSQAMNFSEETIFNSKDTIKINLVLIFEGGKIADIRTPKAGLEFSQIKKYQLEN
jgi:hypothetical protein